IARSEATKQSIYPLAEAWIASRSLSSGRAFARTRWLAMTAKSRLQRQFGLAARVAARIGRGWGGGRARKAPAHRGGVTRVLPDHDLSSAARTVGAGQEHAVLELDRVVERLEGPDVAVRQYQHDAAAVGKPVRLHRWMQMKAKCVVGLVVLEASAGRG